MNRIFTFVFFFVVAIVQGVISNDKTNHTSFKINNSFKEQLKIDFGCIPTDEYKLIKRRTNDDYVKDVCLPTTYQVNEPPDIKTNIKVGVMFSERRILQINERRKSITLLVAYWSFWEDPRMKIKKPLPKDGIALPLFTATHHYIWGPFLYPDIADLREISPVYDPIISRLGLHWGKTANQVCGQELFSQNAPIVIDQPMWKVKIFCRFDFSKYPFDRQNCSFRMVSLGYNLTVTSQRSWGILRENQREFGGYDLRRAYFVKEPLYDRATEQNIGLFGFHIHMSRQIETYFYQYYLPCIAVVITSFFSFIVPLTAIPGRVMIVVTQFLTLTNLFSTAMVL